MNRPTYITLLVAALVFTTYADVYLHMPRGSNNRLQGEGENTDNQNRLFDSQNNARGGYNVGVGTRTSPTDDLTGAMQYYVNTDLVIEWTNQHACGDYSPGAQNDRINGSKLRECEIVLQYACEQAAQPTDDQYWIPRNIRDGFSEDTPPTNKDDPYTGQHEPRAFYLQCQKRTRNKGIFIADRRLNGQQAIYTRQNNAGTRRGYECPEERDYYPYWHPTPWRDIAILTNNPKRCAYYQRESQNQSPKGYCSGGPEFNNPFDCNTVDGVDEDVWNFLQLRAKFTNQISWYLVMMLKLQQVQASDAPAFAGRSWGSIYQLVSSQDGQGLDTIDQAMAGLDFGASGGWKQAPAWNITAPDCQTNLWTRSNHNGNARQNNSNEYGPYTYNYRWTLPQSILDKNNNQPTKCVFRLRYNMSSSDYDNWNTFSWGNQDITVIQNNPKVNNPYTALELAINTAQVGRTFQDRSHVFIVNPRTAVDASITYPDGWVQTPGTAGKKIHNLSVRGKRGNIVQAYPAVEYDFTPNVLKIKAGDYVHFQWTGSNSNPKNYAGQGTAGTDRSNIMQIRQLRDNIPTPMLNTNMWGPINGSVTATSDPYRKHVRAMYAYFALLGQTNPLLNDASPYFNYPPIQFNSTGSYHFLCSRNNNFSNRSQKGTIIVS